MFSFSFLLSSRRTRRGLEDTIDEGENRGVRGIQEEEKENRGVRGGAMTPFSGSSICASGPWRAAIGLRADMIALLGGRARMAPGMLLQVGDEGSEPSSSTSKGAGDSLKYGLQSMGQCDAT